MGERAHDMDLRLKDKVVIVTGDVFVDNVRVPKENVLPGVSSLKGPLSCLTQARYGISWGVIGAAQACLEEALKYSQDRVLFGKYAGVRPVAEYSANSCFNRGGSSS